MTLSIPEIDTNTTWYKDAIIYQLHVRSFYDSNGDGIGDFRGLVQKLDYIQNLGVNTLWLLPFYPSPLKDGGYDIADFTDIHPDYGTLNDFRRFVKEAHRRGLRIITELVLNHTSTEHKWFKRARRSAPGSTYRDYYVWSDTPDKFQDARIIFQDFEVSNWAYDHIAKAYYWHRFYTHQPDLNFQNPKVQKEVLRIMDFWCEIGVDGFRLDAVPYLFESEGTNCENLPETHDYLKALRKYIDSKYPGKLLLAEANQWPNDASNYFGNGDECHMAFHFPLMPRLYMALRMEDRFPVVDIMEQTPKIPETCQWAIFLRNHDELTLEMVSDEERDYMYKAFASDPRKRVNVGIRRRLFPLFGGDTRSIELLNFLLFSMPGTPIVYYGDEIGMGDNFYLGDRDGVRTPMQWSPDKNAGFSHADPQKLFLPVVIDYNFHYTTVNVENQERHPTSFLWWKRRVINKRRQYKAFGRGSIRFVNTSNPKVLAFVREYEDETILVAVNLSRYSQYVELDLHEFSGCVPMEVFSRNDFPVITEEPWPFSMQFKNYFWFELRKPGKSTWQEPSGQELLTFTKSQWLDMNPILQDTVKQRLYGYIFQNNWFTGDTRKLRDVKIIDVFPVNTSEITSYLFLLQLDLIEAEKDLFLMPVSLAHGHMLSEFRTKHQDAVITTVVMDGHEAVLFDGVYNHDLMDVLFGLVRKRSKLKGLYIGEIEGVSGSRLRKALETALPAKQQVVALKRSNTLINVGDRFYFKLYRNPKEGENPDVEINKNLTRHTRFTNISAYLGRIDYNHPDFETTSFGLLVDQVSNVVDGWEMTQTAIEDFFDKVFSEQPDLSAASMLSDENIEELVGPFFLEMVSLLGKRTHEMHLAMASIKEVKGFEPEPFSLLYQKSLIQSMRTLIRRTFAMVNNQMNKLGPEQQEMLSELIALEERFFSYIRDILEKEKLTAMKIRIHGNYKLDKLVFTGKDFIVTDFEGEVEFPLSVRRLKYSPLKDVASMLSSFHYAVHIGYFHRKEFSPVNNNFLRPLIGRWYDVVSETFLGGYALAAKTSGMIPEDDNQTGQLLDLFIIEKGIREIRHFITREPASLMIPIHALQKIQLPG
jgi:maltose alpha-D-glucosyltransferase / alpha-amylase